ncbi:MAG: hypothetical protein H6824_02485 [Planctomycetaceae bacterium]|nr:hypothetical protein [Planctomycetaceae bacterium]
MSRALHCRNLILAFLFAFTFIGCGGDANRNPPPAPNTTDESAQNSSPAAPELTADGKQRVAVVFSGGHETNPIDHGRPVALIGPALGVTPETFREAFSDVRPSPGGAPPSRERAMSNKETLMKVLAPHGITNEQLDTVSNYYRYNPSRGEMWPTRPAKAVAIVENGVVTNFEITDGGSGYSSPPVVRVPDVDNATFEVQLSFGKQLDKNGSVTAISVENR